MKKIIENFKQFLKEEAEFVDDLAWPKEWVDEQRELAVGCKQMPEACTPKDMKRHLKGRPILVPVLKWYAADEQALKSKVDEWAQKWQAAGAAGAVAKPFSDRPHYMLNTLIKIPQKVLLKLRNIAGANQDQDYINLRKEPNIVNNILTINIDAMQPKIIQVASRSTKS